MRDVLLNWHLGSTFGWGILGLNVFLHWANDADLRPLCGQPVTSEAFAACDALRIGRAYAAIEHSNRALAELRPDSDGRTPVRGTVIDALGNDFAPSQRFGERNIGRCIFETASVPARALGKYDALLTGSQWNAQRLAAATRHEVKVIHEGIDPSLFCPGPRSGLMDAQRFYVFSGGKAEFRKGQDLVLAAFRAFAAHRRDCVLVTAWHSIWPQLAVGLKGRVTAPLVLGPQGRLDIVGWAVRNGIDATQVIDVGLAPNALMPAILREMDVALQPSRAEACTSLPVKEAMACGVPVIAPFNTGLGDLLHEDNAIVLRRQGPVAPQGAIPVDDWGESDLDEMVAALEWAYTHREEARALGLRSREWLLAHGRTWQQHAAALKHWLLA